MAIVWFSRTFEYKLGVVGLLAGSLLYLLGFAVPFWLQTELFHCGLWLLCQRFDCSSIDHSRSGSSWKAMQAMECLGLIGLISSQLYTVIANCRHTTLPHSRVLEVVSAVSGMCGSMACMIFVQPTLDPYAVQFYSWGFGFNLAGSILVVISAAVIGYGNRSDLVNQPTAGPVHVSNAA